jgi:DNA-binding transcriptional LysR family regulator
LEAQETIDTTSGNHYEMNVHHLELFYYVAKHGGISEAVRNMPYGIQQPAVSGQIIQLEEHLGLTLFRRRPFELTPQGKELFDFIQPFFGNLDSVAAKLQGGEAHQIRIGASEIVLRDHLPALLHSIKKKFPKLKTALRESSQPDLEAQLVSGSIDLAITILQGKPPPGLHAEELIQLPLVLLAPKSSSIKSAGQLWELDKIEEPLISLPSNEVPCKLFQDQLSRLGVDWFPSVEVSSLDLVEIYAIKGYGVGLSVQVPEIKTSPDLKVLPLPDFPPVSVGMLWRGKPNSLTQMLLDELRKRAVKLKAVSQLQKV